MRLQRPAGGRRWRPYLSHLVFVWAVLSSGAAFGQDADGDGVTDG